MTAWSGPGFPAHEPEPLPDTAVTIGGPRHLRLLDKRFTATCWPAEGICKCGQVVRQEDADTGWQHTGRKPGDSI